jgi:hypothetical protein
MARFVPILAVFAALATTGCRSIGRFPTIDPSDYAYSFYGVDGRVMQVFPYSVPQVESATLQALADLGFRKIDRRRDDGEVTIHAKTIDLRHCTVVIRPRNHMTEFNIHVGVEGDELVSEAVVQRVALNFGALPRTIIPMEPTLAHRIDVRTLPARPAGPVSISTMVPIGPGAPADIPETPSPMMPAAPAELPPASPTPGVFGVPESPVPLPPVPGAAAPDTEPLSKTISRKTFRPS